MVTRGPIRQEGDLVPGNLLEVDSNNVACDSGISSEVMKRALVRIEELESLVRQIQEEQRSDNGRDATKTDN